MGSRGALNMRPQGLGKSEARRGRGYYLAAFADAFARYLPPPNDS